MKLNKLLAVIISIAVLMLVVGAIAAQDDMTYTIMMGGNDELGSFFVDANGMTLYIFSNDTPNVSNCEGGCLENWPALTIGEEERATKEPGIPGIIGFITREDGTRHVVYNGMPLYYFVQDTAPGDAVGQARNDVWWVAKTPHVSMVQTAELGSFLVGEDGMTLYLFSNDADGESACYDQCAANWPPLLVDSADALTTQPGLMGEFGTTERTDGTLQVTYDGMPLYYFVQDTAPGDTVGQARNDVWWVVKPAALVYMGGNDTLGDFLVGPDGMALYLYTKDEEPGVTTCYERCALAWPPLMVGEGDTPMLAEGIPGELSLVPRDDGGNMVAWNGIPLYYWWNDNIPGDSTGQDVGNVWFVIDPAQMSE